MSYTPDKKGKKPESELTSGKVTQVPIHNGTIGTRIEQVAGMVGGKRALSNAIGVTEAQIYRYINGKNLPSVNVIVDMARAAGVNLLWLATGEGQMKGSEPEVRRIRSDDRGLVPELLSASMQAVELAFGEHYHQIAAEERADLVLRLYSTAAFLGNDLSIDSLATLRPQELTGLLNFLLLLDIKRGEGGCNGWPQTSPAK